MKNFSLILFLFIIHNCLFSQELKPHGGGELVEPENKPNCLSDEQRSEIQSMLTENIAELKKTNLLEENIAENTLIVSFDWPLQKTAGLPYNSYYATNNFVDQNAGTGLLDYNCEARTYNGHNGTDIDTWPFPWYIYDNNFVEVIAGEAGTIVGKTDGNDDDHCSCFGNWNAVFVEHADGSVAWYGHMKKNSLTSKTMGDPVSKGEYLGVVASSGCSTQPHLHFEVYDNLGNLIDPYSGACNSLNGASWWASQPANREPTLNALLTHDAVPVHGCPGVSESPNIADAFVSGETIYMATYYHDQLNGDVSNLRIRRPDNSIWQNWSHTSNNTYTKSWWYWNWVLPGGGPFGTWKFEVDYKGQTYIQEFEFLTSLPVELQEFSGKQNGRNSIILNWSTASEFNNSGFELQKSKNGLNWETITFVEGQGNTEDISYYSYVDNNPYERINYYRLKQIDFNNEFEMSKVISIDMGLKEEISIFPNPTFNSISIIGSENHKVQVFDILGRLVIESVNPTNLDLSSLTNGVYLVSIESKQERLVQKVVKK